MDKDQNQQTNQETQNLGGVNPPIGQMPQMPGTDFGEQDPKDPISTQGPVAQPVSTLPSPAPVPTPPASTPPVESPAQPTPSQPQDQPVSKLLVISLILFGLVIILGIFVVLSLVSGSKRSKTVPTATVPTLIPSPTSTPTPTVAKTLEEQVDEVDAGNPEADLQGIDQDYQQL